ncbi:MAG: type II toxin-antitoxin system YoeB family toxin [Gemmatimonadales bacterium]|nr:type II toxin-antitoxin system YoeB family toxin [Gemmatimonadales bacterium]
MPEKRRAAEPSRQWRAARKPEHLNHFGGNVWSRRINESDRLVYEVFKDRVEFLQARYHYG